MWSRPSSSRCMMGIHCQQVWAGAHGHEHTAAAAAAAAASLIDTAAAQHRPQTPATYTTWKHPNKTPTCAQGRRCLLRLLRPGPAHTPPPMQRPCRGAWSAGRGQSCWLPNCPGSVGPQGMSGPCCCWIRLWVVELGFSARSSEGWEQCMEGVSVSKVGAREAPAGA